MTTPGEMAEKPRPRTCPVCSSARWAPCPECNGGQGVGERVRSLAADPHREIGTARALCAADRRFVDVRWDSGALSLERWGRLERAPVYHPDHCPCQGLRMACPDCHSARELDEFKRTHGGRPKREQESFKHGDWVRLKAQPDQDGIVTEIRESGAIVVFELSQRTMSRPFDAIALQAWSFMVEHMPSKPGPVVYPHGMGAEPAPECPEVIKPGAVPALSPKARKLKQLEGEIATGILELLTLRQRPPTDETLREVKTLARSVLRANAMFALAKMLPEGLFV